MSKFLFWILIQFDIAAFLFCDLLVPPSIEEGPTEVAVTVETRAMLMCDTLGLPKPEVTWEKNQKIIPASGSRYMMHRTGSLQFSAVQVEDAGTYRCVANNEAGTVYRDITLTVQGLLKLFFWLQFKLGF